ncbi:hypothetical protein PENSTE_c021G01308 [Penicillium steckii]|uniref:Uncharacterized protein n=1 Tax=Penicillium steckii TaxID=303698 RepID=A0A1V6SU14_9EURO|nr:hypothetical protein PENSTE_c021G01308 [Penicillium steckii]
MRLLRTAPGDDGKLEISQFSDHGIPPYAILSHTWGDDELTLDKLNESDAKGKAGYVKIERCCDIARADGLNYVWIDTCCIDKTSSAELSEAINSMYRWYEEAEVCYVYLADVPSKRTFEESRWFSRGWTLQELISPSVLVFYDETWMEIKDDDVHKRIADCTGIPLSVLQRERDLDDFSIAQRMSWAAKRETTRVEDRAYSLMGLFGVNMPLIYGERETAFIRLQEEIMRISDDHSMFAWESEDNDGFLAPSPSAFLHCQDTVSCTPLKNRASPLSMSGRGVHLEVRFIGIGLRGLGMALLHCRKTGEEDDKYIAVFVRDQDMTMEQFRRVRSEEISSVSLKDWKPSQCPMRKICIQARRTGHMRKINTARSHPLKGSNSEEYTRQEISQIMQFENEYALCDAALLGRNDEVWLLLTRSDIGIDVLSRAKSFPKGVRMGKDLVRDLSAQTPFSLAAASGNTATVRLLLQRGAELNSRDDFGRTPLLLAAQFGHTTVTQILLNMGASIESKDKKNVTALMYAAMNGHGDTINELLDAGATVNSRGGHLEMTALMYAAADGHTNAVEVLLHKGAAIYVVDALNRTAITHAAINGNKDTITALKLGGCDINWRNQEGRTQLSVAAENFPAKKNTGTVVKGLISAGAEIDARDNDGQTPLWWASGKLDNSDTVQILLENGASPSAKSYSGQKPADIARLRGHRLDYELLRRAEKNKLNGPQATRTRRFFK